MTVVLPTSRSTAMHEAHHAAALCLLGMPPKQVRTDWPGSDQAGLVTIDWGDDGPDRDTARSVLIAVILGGMTEGYDGWNDWPIDPDHLPRGARDDAVKARCLAEYLELDHVGWTHVVWKANRLAGSPDFRRLVVAIADELERTELLTAQDLETLVATTEETWTT